MILPCRILNPLFEMRENIPIQQNNTSSKNKVIFDQHEVGIKSRIIHFWQ